MLPIVLVLFVATSTLAAPSVVLNVVDINDVAPPKHNGGLTTANWISQALETNDEGDTTPYVITAQRVLNDLANKGSKSSQALALAQAIALLGSHSTGIPGNACAAAEVIDAYVKYSRSGNNSGIRSAVVRFIQSLSAIIDSIVALDKNPGAQRYATGPRGNCNGGGRTYQFEAAWDLILSNAPASAAGLVNEQYCAAKRLYNAFTSRSNNAGAFITAVSLPSVQRAFLETLVPVSKFMAAIGSGNAQSAAAVAKSALVKAAQKL